MSEAACVEPIPTIDPEMRVRIINSGRVHDALISLGERYEQHQGRVPTLKAEEWRQLLRES